MGTVVVSLHDVAPATWDESRRLLDMVEARGLRCALLIVPGPWRGATLARAPRFTAWLTAAIDRGHEPVLHGWAHEGVDGSSSTTSPWRERAGKVATRGCAEFLTLGRAEAERRILDGLEVLAGHDIEVLGFTPPGWWASPETDEVLAANGFAYTTTRPAVIDLAVPRRLAIPAYCQRPGSPLAARGSRWVARRVAAAVQEDRDVRLALHPADLHDGRLRGVTERLLDLCTRATRALTYAELVACTRPTERRAHQEEP